MNLNESEATARELERELEHDREDLDRTLTELQERLSMQHLIDETRLYASECLKSARQLVSENPVPIAAIALLAGGAMVARSRSRARHARLMSTVGWTELHGIVEDIVDRAVRASKQLDGAEAIQNRSGFDGKDLADQARALFETGSEEIARQAHELLETAQRRIQDGGERLQAVVENVAKSQPGLGGIAAAVLAGVTLAALARRR